MKKIINQINIICFLILFVTPFKSVFAQWYAVADESHKRAVWEMYQVVVPDRQGDFPTKQACEDALDDAGMDALQRSRCHCECESNCDGQNSSNSDFQEEQYNSGQNPERVVVDDYETRMMQRRIFAEKDRKQKAYQDQMKNENIKKEIMGKLKGNKSLDQLKTTSELSEQGLKNNDIEGGRVNTESAFTDGKIKLRRSNIEEGNIPPVPPPTIIENQKKLFEYVDRETKVVQTKILEVQKEKIEILEKKNKLQEKILDQKFTIVKLKTDKIETQEESKKQEIDSLLLEAMQLLDESEQLNENAGKELENKDKLLGEQEALLNKLQTSYDQGKDKPEKSEELLNELQEGKK
jgi:hypothetical protein